MFVVEIQLNRPDLWLSIVMALEINLVRKSLVKVIEHTFVVEKSVRM